MTVLEPDSLELLFFGDIGRIERRLLRTFDNYYQGNQMNRFRFGVFCMFDLDREEAGEARRVLHPVENVRAWLACWKDQAGR